MLLIGFGSESSKIWVQYGLWDSTEKGVGIWDQDPPAFQTLISRERGWTDPQHLWGKCRGWLKIQIACYISSITGNWSIVGESEKLLKKENKLELKVEKSKEILSLRIMDNHFMSVSCDSVIWHVNILFSFSKLPSLLVKELTPILYIWKFIPLQHVHQLIFMKCCHCHT